MRQALIAPLDVAALVLCVAGLAKLRAPGVAGRALDALGLPGRASLVRAFAVAELVLGVVCLVWPTSAGAAALAAVYAAFALIARALARRRAACGCFSGDDAPASSAQTLLSAILALVALAAALDPPPSLGWVAAHSGVLLVGIAGAAYATVLAYTELPRAVSAWSPR